MTTRSKDRAGETKFSVRRLRSTFGLPQSMTARLCGISLRTMASLESDTARRTLPRSVHETRRLLMALAEIVRPEHLRSWLDEPNQEFGGLKPIEVVERGEVDRLWAMIYRVGSGEPS